MVRRRAVMDGNGGDLWRKRCRGRVAAVVGASSKGIFRKAPGAATALIAVPLFLAPGVAAALAFSPFITARAYGGQDVTIAPGDSVTIDGSGAVQAVSLTASSYDRTFTNAGTIGAAATGPGVSMPHGTPPLVAAIGVNANSLNGTLTNSGTIRAAARGANEVGADGIDLDAVNKGGRLVNGGGVYVTNTATGTGGSGGALMTSGLGIGVSYLYGSAINIGTIRVVGSTSGATVARDVGIGIYHISGALNNAGTVSVSVSAKNGDWLYGVGISTGNLDGTLRNSGTIRVAVRRTGLGGLRAYGIEVGGCSGTLINSGTIRVSSDGPVNLLDVAGISVGTLSGTLINSGTIEATPPGSVSGGVASIWVTHGNGTIDNRPGGRLLGPLMIGGTANVNNAGLIDTGTLASLVSGDYTQGPGGVLGLTVTGATRYGTLVVTGNVALSGGSGLRLDAKGYTPSPSDVLSVISSTGGTLSAGPLKVSDNLLGWNFVAAVSGNTVEVTPVTSGLPSTVNAALAGTNLAPAVGSALDNLLLNVGDQPEAVQAFLDGLGSSSSVPELERYVRKALPGAGNSRVTEEELHDVQQVVQARLSAASGLSSGDAYLTDRHFWVRPFGSWAKQDNREGVFGYDATTAGLALGADAQPSTGNRLGAAFAYAHSEVKGNDGSGKNTVSSYQAVLYGSHRMNGRSALSYQLDVGLHRNRSRRDIAAGLSASAAYDTLSAHAGVALSHAMPLGRTTTFTPSVRADYTTLHNDGYRESGAGGLDQNVRSNSVGAFVVGVDGSLNHALGAHGHLLASLGVGYDTINDRSSITSAFAGTPAATFTTPGIKPDPWQVRGGLGYDRTTVGGTRLTARYGVERRQGFTNQTVSFRARWPF